MTWLALAAAATLTHACGHYGPPERASAAPEAPVEAADEREDAERP